MSPRATTAALAETAHEVVREHYGKIASGGVDGSSTSGAESSPGGPEGCCSGGCSPTTLTTLGTGYTQGELASLPEGADLGLGCGNPTALLSLRPGQVVLDLGSGAGIDCFLAARRVGRRGRAIGVDMTPEMLTKARANARKGGYSNVEFRLGEIEHLPVADDSVDVVISNCVINLAPDKGAVYREAFRVLRPGGSFAVSDMVATRPISEKERADPSLWSSCTSGALEVAQVKRLLQRAGFRNVRVDLKGSTTSNSSADRRPTLGVVSADIRATKPEE